VPISLGKRAITDETVKASPELDPDGIPRFGRKPDGTPRKRSNHWVKRRELLDAEHYRKRIKVGALLGKLHSIALGKTEGSAVQVQAIKVGLDKYLPTLQAVEQVNVEQAISRPKHELLAELRAVIQAHPELKQELLGPIVGSSSTQEHDAEQQNTDTTQADDTSTT
jgi:hypothetical protein